MTLLFLVAVPTDEVWQRNAAAGWYPVHTGDGKKTNLLTLIMLRVACLGTNAKSVSGYSLTVDKAKGEYCK